MENFIFLCSEILEKDATYVQSEQYKHLNDVV